jgi:hypothetical protein
MPIGISLHFAKIFFLGPAQQLEASVCFGRLLYQLSELQRILNSIPLEIVVEINVDGF